MQLLVLLQRLIKTFTFDIVRFDPVCMIIIVIVVKYTLILTVISHSYMYLSMTNEVNTYYVMLGQQAEKKGILHTFERIMKHPRSISLL